MEDTKFRVGDRVRATRESWGTIKAGDLGTVIPNLPGHHNALVEFDDNVSGHDGGGQGKDGHCWWLSDDDIELVHEAPTPEAAPITVNITINLYENACWYCKEGGLVDRIFAGQLGICPCCGRVCNDTAQLTKSVKPVKPEKKENKPLTKEELYALPDGTKVFVLFNKSNGFGWSDEPDWTTNRTCWRTKECNTLRWAKGHVNISNSGNGAWKAYLEEPERPTPEPDEVELPF